MQYQLFLLRHAKSDWSTQGQKDFDRELAPRGNLDAPRMGRKLYELGVSPDLIIASTAIRAKYTAQYIAEQLKFDTEKIEFNEEIYEASLRTLLHVINNLPEETKKVMLVGHNPGLTYLAEFLTKKEIGTIPTCGVVSLEFNVDSWAEISGGLADMKWFIFPKQVLE